MRVFLLMLAVISISACNTIEPLHVPIATSSTEVLAARGAAGPSVKFATITKNIPAGERTMVIGLGYTCSLRREYRSSKTPYKDTFTKRVAIAVFEELKAAKYNVVGDPNNPFSGNLATSADYLIGAKVLNTKVSVCAVDRKYSGERYYEIEWSLLKSDEKKVIYSKTTDGYMNVPKEKANRNGSHEMTYGALKMSLRKVLADPEFYNLIR